MGIIAHGSDSPRVTAGASTNSVSLTLPDLRSMARTHELIAAADENQPDLMTTGAPIVTEPQNFGI